MSVTANRPVGVSAPGRADGDRERALALAVRSSSSARRSETSTTIEYRRPARPRPPRVELDPAEPPVGQQLGVVTPAQSPRCSTTPKTLGEPNSVRRPIRRHQLAAAGLGAQLDLGARAAPRSPDRRPAGPSSVSVGLRRRRLGRGRRLDLARRVGGAVAVLAPSAVGRICRRRRPPARWRCSSRRAALAARRPRSPVRGPRRGQPSTVTGARPGPRSEPQPARAAASASATPVAPTVAISRALRSTL